MAHQISRIRALANLAIVAVVVAVAGLGLAQIAKRHWQWQKTFTARVEMPQVGGLEPGGKVRVQGMDAGVVEAIVAPSAPGQPVTLILRMDERLKGLVRADASARIASLGVIGAKVVEIVPGKPDAPALAEGGTLTAEPTVELADLLRDASIALKRVDAVAVAAEQGLGEINAIAAEIRAGRGSLGKLVRDDEAYQRFLAMSSRGEKVLGNLDENLMAMKNTWPISRYFNGRGFDDRDRVLFQPGSEREVRSFRGDDLFEPGRAVLTAVGQRQLDEFARWFGKTRRPKTAEIVIAAFTDDATSAGDEDMAQALTQEQAEAVRRYLTDKHAIDSTGWFTSRKVAAVGFGTQTPRTLDGSAPPTSTRRVEIFVFTPQA